MEQDKVQYAISLLEKTDLSEYFAYMQQEVGDNATLNHLRDVYINSVPDVKLIDKLRIVSRILLTSSGKTDYADFLTNIEVFGYNQNSATSLPLQNKGLEYLSDKAVAKLLQQERTIQFLEEANIPTEATLQEQLRALYLMPNGFVIKGTFMCLAKFDEMRGVTDNAHISRFVTYEDNTNNKPEIIEDVAGNLIEQYEKMMRHIRKNMYLLRDPFTSTDEYEIPESAFKEIVANAFVHQSYETNTNIQLKVELYADRLVVYNPCNPKLDVNINQLAKDKISYIPNKEIVQIFYLHKYMDRIGSGVDRCQKILQEKGLPPAVIEQKQEYVKVTLYKKRKQNIIEPIPTLPTKKSFWQKINDFFLPTKNTTIEDKLKEPYKLLDNNDIAGFFLWAEKQNYKGVELALLKKEYIAGKTNEDFAQRLKLIAQIIVSEKQ